MDTAKAGALAGGGLEKADAAFVREHTGFAIGGVPAVAHARPITVLVDRDLTAFDDRLVGGGDAERGLPDRVRASSSR